MTVSSQHGLNSLDRLQLGCCSFLNQNFPVPGYLPIKIANIGSLKTDNNRGETSDGGLSRDAATAPVGDSDNDASEGKVTINGRVPSVKLLLKELSETCMGLPNLKENHAYWPSIHTIV